jgi:hypothetical protein
MNIEHFLMLLSGIAWSIVYVDAIRIGIKDRSYAMPFWALALNIAWEFSTCVIGVSCGWAITPDCDQSGLVSARSWSAFYLP